MNVGSDIRPATSISSFRRVVLPAVKRYVVNVSGGRSEMGEGGDCPRYGACRLGFLVVSGSAREVD